jgi:hypothetical protein
VSGLAAVARAAGVSSALPMKTGKLLKFQRPAGEVQAYVYREGGVVNASVYVLSAQGLPPRQPAHTVSGASEAKVEADVRAWIDTHFPKAP